MCLRIRIDGFRKGFWAYRPRLAVPLKDEMTQVTRSTATPVTKLHESLNSPVIESTNLLNEVADRVSDALSFAADRPFEGLSDLIVDPGSIAVTVGFQEALHLVLRALLRTERNVLLAVLPGYVGMLGAAQLVDMAVLPVRPGPLKTIDLAELVTVVPGAKMARLNPRALYISADLANPPGESISLETRRELLRLADEHGFLIIENNPYGIFHGDRDARPTLKALTATAASSTSARLPRPAFQARAWDTLSPTKRRGRRRATAAPRR